MCQRLEHLTKTPENVWYEAFKDSLSKGLEIFDMLHNKDQISSAGLPQELEEHLKNFHVQLFGFNASTLQKTVMIQCFRSDGNQYVKQVLSRICPPNRKDNWTSGELIEDPDRVNLTIKPVGLPKMLITVTASDQDRAEQTMTDTLEQLQAANFNIMMVL